MQCAWQALIGVLPPRLRGAVDNLGRDSARELRLRLGRRPELVLAEGSRLLAGEVRREDLDYVVNAASRYSPWAAQTAAQGYLSAPGGHRIGLCGTAVCREGQVEGVRELSSLCIRVARDIPGVGERAGAAEGSLLIVGAPGWGKTTLLRDVIRIRSRRGPVCAVDERGELFPPDFDRGSRTDVLTGCPKAAGVMMALRTMSPDCIAVDEITREADARTLLQAANCGVSLLATVHAAGVEELRKKPMWKALRGVFGTVAVLGPDKTYRMEEMAL